MTTMDIYTTSRIPSDQTGYSISVESTTQAVPPPNNHTQKPMKEMFYNGTGYYIEDEVEPGLNDLQTLLLACFATLIPLVISLLTAYGIRLLWIKHKRQKQESKYRGMLNSGDTEESLARPLHSHLLNDKKCAETHLVITTDEMDEEGITHLRSNNHCNTNGSIITMTLKNNHLIVETEERNDIEEDSRETTMKYSPGARDGVFVVEVQQGMRRSPGSGGPASCGDPELVSASVSDQCALVHNPPDRYSDDVTIEECDDNDYYIETTSTSRETPYPLVGLVRTGLAQSNVSLTEADRQTYSYTNQQCYDNGKYGYPLYESHAISNEPLQRVPSLVDDKPKITDALYKNQSRWEEEDDVQEEQRRLGNCIGKEDAAAEINRRKNVDCKKTEFGEEIGKTGKIDD